MEGKIENESVESAKEGENDSLRIVVVKGSAFTYDRLAEDMLSYLLQIFQVQKRLIPPPRFARNSYVAPANIHLITRQTRMDQIVHRNVFYQTFVENKAEDAAKDHANIYIYIAALVTNMRQTLQDSGMEDVSPILLFHLSMALVTEMTLYYISKKNRSIVKKMAQAWTTFFHIYLKTDFEDAGGLRRVLLKPFVSHNVDKLIFEFIPRHCVPYSGADVHPQFIDLVEQRSSENVDLEVAKLKLEIEKKVACLRLGIKLKSPMSPEEEYDSDSDPGKHLPVHDRLGIVPHEEILKDVDSKSPAEAIAAAPATDASTAAAIAALSLAAERKKAKKEAKAKNLTEKPRSVQRSVQPVQLATDANAATTSSAELSLPEARPNDRVPSLHGPYQSDPVVQIPDMTRSSGSENQTAAQPDYSSRGAKPKTRRSSKK